MPDDPFPSESDALVEDLRVFGMLLAPFTVADAAAEVAPRPPRPSCSFMDELVQRSVKSVGEDTGDGEAAKAHC
jgi:hypothetical protein